MGLAQHDARVADLKLGVKPKYDGSRYEIQDLEAKSHDGVMVPLTLVRPKSTGKEGNTPQIVLIQAYGAYGISQLANFSMRTASFLDAGGTYASCHVRGGGELGDAWRLAGKDADKPNTWRDLIACAEDLIARGYTYKEAAGELYLSVKTIETHVSAVLRKLQLSNRHELTRWAADRRIL